MINKISWTIVFSIFLFSSFLYAKEDTMFVSSSSGIYMDAMHTKLIGTLKIGTKVYIIDKKVKWYKIKTIGWQQNGLSSVIYAFGGLRIINAKLTPNGEKVLKSLKSFKDKNTNLTWNQVELDNVWINAKALSKNMDKVWKKADILFNNRCSICHSPPVIKSFTANQWPVTLKSMAANAALDKKQTELVTKYLQYHAQDAIEAAK
ncbi:MAG: hypothetical protein QM482_00005 [Sulfurospirillum sp.]